jgi:hypothetical protein
MFEQSFDITFRGCSVNSVLPLRERKWLETFGAIFQEMKAKSIAVRNKQ